MNLMLDIAASLYEVKNFQDMRNVLFDVLNNLTPHILISGKIGIYNEEIDEYSVYYLLKDDKEINSYVNDRVREVNISCKFKEIAYFSRIVADTRKKLIIQDNHSKESLDVDPEQAKFPSHGMLWIPLLNGDKFLGIISFAGRPAGSLTPEIINILEALAKIISIKVNDILTTEKLYKSEEKYRNLVEFADDAIVLTSMNGKVLFRNHAYYAMLGFEYGEPIENDGIKRIHPEDQQRFKNSLRQIFDTNLIREEYRIKSKSGEWVSQEAKIVLIRNGNNQPESYLSIIRDRREAKKSEEMLKTIEERFHSLSSLVREGIMIHDNGIILDANQAFADLAGVSNPQDMIGKKGYEVMKFTPESERVVLDHIRSRENNTYEVEIIKNDGKNLPIEVTGREIMHIDRKARLVYIRDITEQKRAEQARILNEKRLRQIIDLVPHFIFAKDSEGRFILANKAVAEVYGTTVEELTGKSDADFVKSEGELDHFREYDNMVLNSGKSIVIGEEHITDSDGEIRILSTTKIPFTFSGTNLPALLGVSIDITERKRAENALRENENKYRNLIEQTTDGVFVLNFRGKCIDINSGACNMIGYSRKELLSMEVSDLILIDDKDRLAKIFSSMLKGENLLIEKSLKHKNGKYIDTEINAGLLGNDKICAFVRDITGRRKAEEEHLRLQNLESLGMLAGGIAHDFNNILSTVLGRTSMALRRNPDMKVMNDLRSIENAAKSAVNLTKQLLTFAKGGTPEKCIIDLQKIILDTTDFALSGSNVIPIFNLKDSFNVEADPGQMSQVIQNLVINAKQSMPSGGTIKLSTEDFIELDGNLFVIISIEDMGIGIPKEQINKIFDPYFTTKDSGSGLGLSVCHSIITRHGGKIHVKSKTGKGTTFSIILPATKKEIRTSGENKKIVTKNLNILIMDDEESIRDLLSNMLDALGHNVSAAKEGYEAINKYREAKENGNNFDLVFMDLTVRGGVGGKDAVNILRKYDRNAKVIVSSGYANSSIATYKEDGFDAVLKKPYTIEDLNAAIYDIFER